MNLSNASSIKQGSDAKFKFFITIGKGRLSQKLAIDYDVNPDQYEEQKSNPIFLEEISGETYSFYLFHNKVIKVEEAWGVDDDELLIRIKHFVLKQEKDFYKATKEVEAYERMSEAQDAKREKISESVKLFVWQRDEGKCVKCGSNQKLEFDHIIPFAYAVAIKT